MLDAVTIRSTLREVLRSGVERVIQSNELAKTFACDPSLLSERVLTRHWIEHVKRIRAFRPLDVRARQLLTKRNPAVAAVWGQYARSEAVHDRYFLRDLESVGLERSIVDATLPFPSTVALIRFMKGAMHEWGPLPGVLYSFWAEENSDAGSQAVVERARIAFGPDATRGAAAHRRLDETLDHPGLISDVLTAIIRTLTGLHEAAELLGAITEFIGGYFADLDVAAGIHLDREQEARHQDRIGKNEAGERVYKIAK